MVCCHDIQGCILLYLYSVEWLNKPINTFITLYIYWVLRTLKSILIAITENISISRLTMCGVIDLLNSFLMFKWNMSVLSNISTNLSQSGSWQTAFYFLLLFQIPHTKKIRLYLSSNAFVISLCIILLQLHPHYCKLKNPFKSKKQYTV